MYNGKHYIIREIGLEIFYKDLPFGKTFNQYKSLCLGLRDDGWRLPTIGELSYGDGWNSDGWRLPTIEELSYMCNLSQLGILGFSNDYYWSSEQESVYFPLGTKTYEDSTIIEIRARPVRTVSL